MISPWIMLSGGPVKVAPAAAGATALVLECTLPIAGPTVLVDWQGPDGAALSLFADPQRGISALIRQGDRVARHRMAGAIGLPPSGIVRLTLASDPGAARWTLRVEAPGTSVQRTTRGRDPLALEPLAGMTSTGTLSCNPAVLWFGLARGQGIAVPPPWIGPATPVDTPDGPRLAGSLHPGDIVSTLAGPRALADVTACETPVSGSLAPVRLRAPWFGERTDLIVSPDQPVMLSGVAVEYLFGEDLVLTEAGLLTSDTAAIRDGRPGILRGICLALPPDGDPRANIILADGCALPTAACTGMRRLAGYEAVPLRLHLGRGLRARAA